MTGFNIKEENYIHASILFRFHRGSDDDYVINYYILYAKHYIYLELLGYLCHLKYILKIEKNICTKKN